MNKIAYLANSFPEAVLQADWLCSFPNLLEFNFLGVNGAFLSLNFRNVQAVVRESVVETVDPCFERDKVPRRIIGGR